HNQGSIIIADDVKSAICANLIWSEDETRGPLVPLESSLELPSSILKISGDETMAMYLRRVKLEVLQTAIAFYSDRTVAAERLGLAQDTVRKQLRRLRRTTVTTNH